MKIFSRSMDFYSFRKGPKSLEFLAFGPKSIRIIGIPCFSEHVENHVPEKIFWEFFENFHKVCALIPRSEINRKLFSTIPRCSVSRAWGFPHAPPPCQEGRQNATLARTRAHAACIARARAMHAACARVRARVAFCLPSWQGGGACGNPHALDTLQRGIVLKSFLLISDLGINAQTL